MTRGGILAPTPARWESSEGCTSLMLRGLRREKAPALAVISSPCLSCPPHRECDLQSPLTHMAGLVVTFWRNPTRETRQSQTRSQRGTEANLSDTRAHVAFRHPSTPLCPSARLCPPPSGDCAPACCQLPPASSFLSALTKPLIFLSEVLGRF